MRLPRLHIVTTVPQSLYALIAGQPRLLADSFTVTLVASPGAALDAVAEREGVKTQGVPMTRSITPIVDVMALWRLYRLFRRERPQIVQSYTPKAGLLAMAAARLAKVPVRIHGIVGMPLMEVHGLRRVVLELAERMTYVLATRLICNSTGLRTWVEANLSPNRALTIVGDGSINGVDVNHFAPGRLELRRAERARLGIHSDAVVYVFLGRLVHAKGIEELVQSFTRLRQDRDDVVLLLVGEEEPLLDPLSPAARECLRSTQGIVRVGWQDDVRPVLAAADVCVLPSHREGLPNTLLEAAASGLPALATDINGCNEVVEHGRTGILVPVKNHEALYQGLIALLDHHVRRTMGVAARERVMSRYEHEAFCSALLGYYRWALADSDPAALFNSPLDADATGLS